MVRKILGAMIVCSVFAFAACGSDTNPTDTGNNEDVIIPGLDNGNVGDTAADQGTDRDTVGTDTNGTDTNVGTDTNGTDTNVGTDTNGTDTNVGTDTNTTDECSGACDPTEGQLKCMPDGTTICFCSGETNTWAPYVCAEVCTQAGMVGEQCIPVEDSFNCDCSYDCTQPALVETQCTDTAYTPCTCSETDPCSWLGDAYCDADCATLFPDDHFTDADDCTCEGACDPEEFASFCVDGDACNCDTDAKAPTDCATLCADMGGEPDPEGSCFVSEMDGAAYCACINFSCDDTDEVNLQCSYGYTECTCAAADPCGWVADEYCDTQYCNQIFPDQTNFDDSASEACQAE